MLPIIHPYVPTYTIVSPQHILHDHNLVHLLICLLVYLVVYLLSLLLRLTISLLVHSLLIYSPTYLFAFSIRANSDGPGVGLPIGFQQGGGGGGGKGSPSRSPSRRAGSPSVLDPVTEVSNELTWASEKSAPPSREREAGREGVTTPTQRVVVQRKLSTGGGPEMDVLVGLGLAFRPSSSTNRSITPH